MRPRFPGMDPWLEHPGLWPDVHNSLIAAIRDDLAARVAPRYFVGVEQHTYVTSAAVGDLAIIRPDLVVGRTKSREGQARRDRPGRERADVAVAVAEPEVGAVEMNVLVPVGVRVEEWYLEVRAAATGKLVTVIEVLSPTNKAAGDGRKEYLRKRRKIFKTRTSLVEIDLLRAGRPMPIVCEQPVATPYRILISRGATRPRARFYGFGVRHPIPIIPIPLLPKDAEPPLDLGAVLHALYDRARFDLRVDYEKPPVPPLGEAEAAWAKGIVAARAEAR